jgi:hypothetical protein
MHQELGIEHWILSIGREDEQSAQRSLRLMAEEVLPIVKHAVGVAEHASVV